MTSPHQPFWQVLQRPRADLHWWWGGLVVSLGVLGLSLVGLLDPVINLSHQAVVPVEQLGVGVVQVVPSTWNKLHRFYRLERQVQDLERSYNQALAEISALEGVEAENQQLRALVENTNRKLVPSVVTSPIISYGLPAVAVGSDQNVTEGAAVLVQQTVVGRISQVGPQQSAVTLLSQTNVEPLLAQSEQGAMGIVRGDGKRILFTEVSLAEPLEIGERIVTVAQPGMPADLLVGIVQEIDTDPAAPVKTAIVSPLVSFYDGRIVEVTIP